METNAYDYFGYLIKRVQQEFRTVMDAKLATFDLTTTQYATLTACAHRESVSNAELARACFVTPQTMIRIIINLEEMKFVSRQGSASNDRIIEIEITEKGRKTLAKAHSAVQKIEVNMVRGLGKAELATMRTGLAKFIENLERAE